MARERKPSQDARIDLTPMIDVTFLLLIFFICTLSFRVLEGKFESHLPKDVGTNAIDEVAELRETFEVTLEPDARGTDGLRIVALRRVFDSPTTLGAIVKRSRAADPELRVKLNVDGDVTHGQVVSVVDALVASGQEQILFAEAR